jgi:alpha-tubulin suppressor-like RCC1 family protein
VVSLNTGGAHACAATTAAETYCWGRNIDGQIGRGDRESASSPVRILVPPR